MPYKVEDDTTLPRVLASGQDADGNEYVETESVVYRRGQVVYEDDLAPSVLDRLEEGDSHLDSLLTHVSESEAEEIRSASAAGVAVPEHEAEAEVLRQDGKEVAGKEEKIEIRDEKLAEVSGDSESDTEDMTVAELKERASELDIEGYSTMKKAELQEAVSEAEASE